MLLVGAPLCVALLLTQVAAPELVATRKKTGQYHEMATVYSVNSFFWDALVYADDWAPI
jgi:hypothetical protein